MTLLFHLWGVGFLILRLVLVVSWENYTVFCGVCGGRAGGCFEHNGHTALHNATQCGHGGCWQHYGCTPLYVAAVGRHMKGSCTLSLIWMFAPASNSTSTTPLW